MYLQDSSKEQVVDYQQVGIRIKELRKAHNFSQQAFAELLNISQGHLSRVEKGSVISAALCNLIAEKFNTSMEYLLAGQEQKPLNATPSVPPVSKTKPAAFPSISLDQSDSIAASNKKIKKLLEDCKYEYSFIVDEIHDVAAGMMLVQEAGEVVTSFQGEAVNPSVSERIGIVANVQLHPLCVDLLGTME